jgi:hypothetical protein
MTAVAAAPIAIGVAGAVVIAVLGAWVAYMLHVGTLDARDLAEKTAFRRPRSALEWPELRLGAVVAQPERDDLVLVSARWPAHPSRASVLLLQLQGAGELRRLSRWCAAEAPITVRSAAGHYVELRRRRTVERVHALVVDESPG